jgi:uroporphyrinogen decarboxylase
VAPPQAPRKPGAQQEQSTSAGTRTGARSEPQLSGGPRPALDPTERMLRACRGEPVDRPPVWLMRQAGRYLPEYRALRAGIGFLDMCRDVERAVEVSLQPIRLVGSEAVVFFCDIFVPVLGMGVGLDFAPGPVMERPLRTRAQVEALVRADPRESVPYVFEILRRLRRELAPLRIPLIGFAGAPFTLATYLVEGQGDPTRRYPNLRRLMREEPALVEALLERLAEMTLDYLRAQIEAGAQVVQLFDTWAGVLAAADYERWLLPGTRAIAAGLAGAGAPFILYLNDAPHLLDLTLESGADVLSIGAAVEMGDAARRAGRRASLQGNLDPHELERGRDHIFARVREIAAAARPARGLILNLGHGCLPDTPVEGVRAFTDAARALAPA